MICIKRKLGQSITLLLNGERVVVTLQSVRGKLRLAIDAAPSVRVVRTETEQQTDDSQEAHS